ncbi:hypothetical protein PaG_06278 [Moesziomyces aphidis]|uniref:Peroxin-3 n=1 Tax=Moesziomyces aphidis TaxID=84754 RepID=W3VE25_MOEAP|nr:hypothetical protein PaG_06278 [Moesziomyces aphidis]
MTSWWRRTSRYISSHSNFFVVTGGLVGGAYLLSQYAISKFQQIQEKLVNDKNAKENLRRRFAQNQEDCTFTVLALLPTLGDQLFAKHDVEQLTESLRSQAAPPAPSTITSDAPQPLAAEPAPPAPIAASASDQQDPQPPQTAEHPASEPQSTTHTLPQPDAPSPQLNPLAKTFVPGGAPAPAQTTQPSVDTAQANGSEAAPDAPVVPEAAQQLPTPQSSDEQPTGSPQTTTDTSAEQLAQTQLSPTVSAVPPPSSEQSQVDAQQQRSKIIADRHAKLRLWNDLKLTSFTRAITSLYCVVLLTLQTHIQLNLIGRFAYLASVEALARESDDPSVLASASHLDSSRVLDHDTERLYLTFSWWFLHRGWNALSDRVADAIARTFSPLSVKAQLSLTDLKALVNDARFIIEHEPSSNATNTNTTDQPAWKRSHFLDVLFPNSTEDEADVLVGAGALDGDAAVYALATNDKLRALLDETKDIIESQDFGTILSLCFDRVFETFFDSLCPTFGVQKSGRIDSTIQVEPLSALESRFQEITDEMQHGKRVRLASLFPLVSRQSQMAIRGVPNEYIEVLADAKELRAFSAVLYAAWSPM